MNRDQVILRTIARQAVYVIMVFSFFLYGRGHNEPGGGFIAGLMSSAGVVALYMAFNLPFVKKAFPIDYLKVIAVGLLFAVGTGLGTMFGNELFMNHTFAFVQLPFFGELELTTAAIFDFGVYLVVVGGTLTIISMIGGER